MVPIHGSGIRPKVPGNRTFGSSNQTWPSAEQPIEAHARAKEVTISISAITKVYNGIHLGIANRTWPRWTSSTPPSDYPARDWAAALAGE